MSALRATALVAALCLLQSCQKKDGDTPVDSPVPETPTQISVWMDGHIGDALAVSLDGVRIGDLVGSFASTPLCGQAGTITVSVPAGAHTLSANGGGIPWSPIAVSAVKGQCAVQRFSVPPGLATRLMFWLSGTYTSPVSVSVDGVPVSGAITTAYPSVPVCGSAGTVAAALSPGPHTITAVAGTTRWGPATVSATSGECLGVQLTSTGGMGSGSTGGTTSFTLPNTDFMYMYAQTMPKGGCAWSTDAFALTSTASLTFRFAVALRAQAAIIPASQLTNFKACQAFTSYVAFDAQFGTQGVTLPAGTYYIAVRSAQDQDNKFSYEVDYDYPEIMRNPESGKSFVRVASDAYSQNVAKLGGKFAQPFTIESGYRYFVDGVNTGELDCFVIPANSLTAFQSGQGFTAFSQYSQSGGICPGNYELNLPPGSYALAFRNPSPTAASSLTFTIERWRIQ